MLLFVAGAVFGEVQVSLLVAGAVYSVKFGMIAGARNVVFCNTNCSCFGALFKGQMSKN